MIKFIIGTAFIGYTLQFCEPHSLNEHYPQNGVLKEQSNSEGKEKLRVRIPIPVPSSGTTGPTLSLIMPEIYFCEHGNVSGFDFHPEKGHEVKIIDKTIVNGVYYTPNNSSYKFNKRLEPVRKRKKYPGRR